MNDALLNDRTARSNILTRSLDRYKDNEGVVRGIELIRNSDGEPTGLIKGFNAEVKALADGAVETIPTRIEYVMTTDAVDRMNDIVNPGGLNIRNFNRNPVALWSHNHSIPNVGKWEQLLAGPVGQDGNSGVRGILHFHNESELSRELNAMAARGFLNAVSIGFLPLDWEEETTDTARKRGLEPYPFSDTVRTYTKIELLECSPCNVPMNPTATIMQTVERGVRDAIEQGVIRSDSEVLGAFGMNRIDAGNATTANATSVVALQQFGTVNDNLYVDGGGTGTTTAGTFEKTTTPETNTPPMNNNETPDTVVDPIVDTPEQIEEPTDVDTEIERQSTEQIDKAGAVLNRSNRAALEKARDAIQSVLDSADKEADKSIETDITDATIELSIEEAIERGIDPDADWLEGDDGPALEVDGIDVAKTLHEILTRLDAIESRNTTGADTETDESATEERSIDPAVEIVEAEIEEDDAPVVKLFG